MATYAIDTAHGCADGGAPAPGAIAVLRKASSDCCNAMLAEGGTDETGHACTQCHSPCARVLGEQVAHWTCKCGTPRRQVVTQAQDG